MAYGLDAKVYNSSLSEIGAPRPMATSPDALGDLGRASTEYAAAAAAFISARHDLNDARARWQGCMSQVEKAREDEDV